MVRSYSDSNFTVINHGGHSQRIQGVRVIKHNSNSYGGTNYLQVYVNPNSGTSITYYVSVFKIGDQTNWSAFTAETPVISNLPTNYIVHGNELDDLYTYGFAHEEGIQAGGNIKAGGDLTVVGNTNYGSSNRQMINLYNQNYGIGVQTSTTYFRTDNDFQFYKGGSHNDSQGNAGGGTKLLTIKSDGDVGIGAESPSSKLHLHNTSESYYLMHLE